MIMADPLSGVAIIIFIAFGVLTIVLLFIFANRQIKRFSLKSKYGPHMPIAQDAPKNLQMEINRRLDIIKSITYQPPLLKKSDEIYFEDEQSSHMPCHLYRMKALDSLPALEAAILSADSSKVRPFHQDYRVYLIRLAQSGLFGQIEMINIHKFSDLYEAARHEPGSGLFGQIEMINIHKFSDLYEAARHEPEEFDKEKYLEFMTLLTLIQESLSSKSSNRQQPTSKNASNNTSNSASVSHSTETVKNCIDTKSSVVPSLQVENSEEEKATYETSV